MASILLLLRAHEQHYSSVSIRDPALPTDGWIHTMMCLMKQQKDPILVAKDDWDFTHFYPRSGTIRFALERLVNEDMIRRLKDEDYPTYVTSQWGRVYLDKVYRPVLGRHAEGFYFQLIDGVQERVEKSIGVRFGALVRRVKAGRTLARNP